ncbi:MAG: GAF domain-containing protein, partial [Chloroflexota bacterium]
PYEPIMQRGGLCDAVLRENSMVLFGDLTQETHRMEMMGILPQEDEPGHDRRSWLGVPLQNSDGEVLGVVGVNSSAPGQYDDQDSSLLMTVTAQLSLSLQNARLLQSEQKRRQIADTLIDVGRIVANTLRVDEVLPVILEQMRRVVSFDQASIMLLEPDPEPQGAPTLVVEISAAYGGSIFDTGQHVRYFNDSAIMQVHTEKKPVVIRNTRLFPGWSRFEGLESTRPVSSSLSWLGVPMIIQDRIIGYISLSKIEANHFTDMDADTAFAMAQQAAIAVNNARLYTSELERRQMADTLLNVGQAVASSLELEEVLDRILEAIQTIVNFDGATVMLQANGVQDASEMVVRAMRGGIQGYVGMHIYFTEDSLNTKVFRNGQPIIVDDVQKEIHFNGIHEDGSREEQTRSWICVPLVVQNRFLGFINVDKFEPGYFTRRDADTVFALARQAAVAVDNARLFKAEQERRKVANSLIDVGRIVAATLDQDRVLTLILGQLQRVVNFDGATIQLNAPGNIDGTQLIVQARRGTIGSPAGTHITYHEGHPIRTIYETQKPLIIEDIREEPGWFSYDIDRRVELMPIRGWLGVPMMIQNQIIGVLTLDKFEEDFYTERDADTVFALARQAAVAVENARLHQKQNQALHTLQMRARRLTTLHRIATVVSSTLERDRVMSASADLSQELFGADGCMIALTLKDAETMYVAHSTNDYSAYQMVFMAQSNLFQSIMTERDIMSVMATEDNVNDPMLRLMAIGGMRSLLIAPLVVNDRVIGFIGLDMQHRETPLENEEYQTYAAIAQQVAVAIYNAELYEEALVANQLKSQFLANISHELRTPLNAIIGYTEMTVEGIYGLLNEQQNDRLSRVLNSGQHLLALISDVLDLSKIEAGQMELELVDADPTEIVKNSLMLITPQAEEKGLSLEVSLMATPPFIHVDMGRIQQVVTNLLSNAVKFTDEGCVSLTTTTIRVKDGASVSMDIPSRLEVEDGTWLAISVEDTGIGISDENQKFIFDAFRQADGSAARRHQGTGLGLAIAREISQMHGGHVWVSSEIGAGSTFTVLLPIPHDGNNTPARLIESSQGSDRNPTVLVIDDDATTLQLMQDYLDGERYRVLCTNSALHGLKLVTERTPAVVLLDVDMPEMTGFDVLEEMRDNPRTADIPVVMVSILALSAEANRLGAADYMMKPLDRNELVRVIEQVISKEDESTPAAD